MSGVPATNVAQLKGTNWMTLGAGLDSLVTSLVWTDDGLVAGGFFEKSGTNTLNHAAKWDGISWAPLGEGLSSNVLVMAAANGGQVFAAIGTDANQSGSIFQWDGANWSQVGQAFSNGSNGKVAAMVWDRGELYAAGLFDKINDTSATNIARWDGKKWSVVGDASLVGEVRTLAAIDQRLYAGGDLKVTRTNQTNSLAIVRLDTNTWTSVLGQEAVPARAIAGWRGNLFVVAGYEKRFIASRPMGVVWHFNGEEWGLLNSGLYGFGLYDMVVQPEGLVISSVNNSPVIWNGQTFDFLISTNQSRLVGLFHDMAKIDGTIWGHGGLFTPDPGQRTNGVILSGQITNVLVSLSNGFWNLESTPMPISVSALAGYRGAIIVGGLDQRRNAGGVESWDGTAWSSLGESFGGPNSSSAGHIACLVNFRGRLFIGGSFTNIGPQSVQFLAEWDGQKWQPVPGSPNGPVSAFFPATDKLYVGGNFTEADGLRTDRIASWLGDKWERVADGITNGIVGTIAVSRDGLIAAGGTFSSVAGIPASGLAIWHGDHWTVPDAQKQVLPVNPSQVLWQGHDLFATDAYFQGPSFGIWHEPSPLLDASLLVRSNKAVISVTGAVPKRFVLERSTDIASWTSVATNEFGNARSRFYDTPVRSDTFYRMRALPSP